MIICIVFCNSAASAVSRRNSSRFCLISLSDHLKICFQAHIIEVSGKPPPGSDTASFAVVIFFARFSNSNISACEDGLFIVRVKLFNSSWKPLRYKCITAILLSSINNACCILFTVLVKRTSSKERFFPSPVLSSKFKNDLGTLNAVNTLFCTNLISSIAVRFCAPCNVSIGLEALSSRVGMKKSSVTFINDFLKSICPVKGSTIGVLLKLFAIS